MSIKRNDSTQNPRPSATPAGGVAVCAADCPGRTERTAPPRLGVAVQATHRVNEQKDEGWHVFAALATAVAAGAAAWILIWPLMLLLSVMGRMQRLSMDLPDEAVTLGISMLADCLLLLAVAASVLYCAYKAVTAVVVAIVVMIRLARAHRAARQEAGK